MPFSHIKAQWKATLKNRFSDNGQAQVAASSEKHLGYIKKLKPMGLQVLFLGVF